MMNSFAAVLLLLPLCFQQAPADKPVGISKGPCHEEHAKISKLLNGSPPVVGATLPDCEDDGSYKPIQCSGAMCYCTTPDGKVVPGTSVGIWETEKIEKIDCSKLQTRQVKGPCHLEHAKISVHLKKYPYTVGATLPECEEDGTYKPVQCKGSQCYCVKPNGEQVVGASVGVWEREKLDCSKLQTRQIKGPCHLEHAEISVLLKNTVGATLPECEEDGTYKPVQCKGSQCYCVKPNGEKVVGASVGVWEREKLDCSKLQTREIKGPCHLEHAKISERLKKYPNTVGATLPECEEDGTYKPVQCKGSQCFCVTMEGVRILKYSRPIWASREMDCECARTLAELNSEGAEGKQIPAEVLCDSKGSFVIE